MVITGHCDQRFEGIALALQEELDAGAEVGAAIAVDIDGEFVVDVWGGHADRAKTIPWTEHTIVNLFSVTKTISSLAALILVDRGLVDITAPVASYWPEFAANGKEDIEVRHVLSHTSGVAGWDAALSLDEVYDVEASTALLAAQAPWWPLGSASGYHAFTYGHLVGELVRRVTGRSLTDFVRDEIAAPLGADVQIGARSSDDSRIAEIIPPPPLDVSVLELLPEDHPMRKTFRTPPPTAQTAAAANTVAWRRAELGAVNGHANARSLVHALAPIALGGVRNRVRLLKPETIALIFDEQASGPDLTLGLPVRFGVGYGLPQPESFPYLPTGSVCFWTGWGGSMISMDLDRRVTIGYVMNRMGPELTGSARTQRYTRLVYEVLR